MSTQAIELTDAAFQKEVLASDTPVLVDFWAPWCGPCKMISPIIDEIAAENAGKLKVCKLNVDENQQSAMDYKVMSIPTLIVFKNGEAVETIIGGTTKDALLQKITPHLG